MYCNTLVITEHLVADLLIYKPSHCWL